MSFSLLIVDDSKVSRRAIKQRLIPILEDRNPVIHEAVDGQEALEFCRNQQFSLVLLDLTMPKMTGYELLDNLKKESIEQTIIVLTADIQPEAEKTVRSLGAKGYLEKPFDKEAAINILKEINIL